MKWSLLSILVLTSTTSLFAQEAEVDGSKKLTMRGYLKEMVSFNYYGDSLLFQNLVHNRINFAWYPDDNFTVHAELRTRLYSGDLVRKIPNYSSYIDSNNDYFDLSGNLTNNKSLLLNTMIDRLYVQWAKNNWEIKAGRQRINWGVNLAWNPNDWFNAYSFYDFDYEERPGSDAVRISYYTGAASSVEVAAKASRDVDHFVAASMLKLNKWDYDIQILGGLAQGDLAMGTGWAGNLWKASFKGELTFFHNVIETEFNNRYSNMFLGAISVDYSFPGSLYLNGSIMYNSQGSYNPDFAFTVFGTRPGTVRNLSPYKWSSFIQSTYQLSPLFFAGLALIGYPGSDALFINPSLTISASQNIDIDVIGQLLYGNNPAGSYQSLLKAGYVRVKWSF